MSDETEADWVSLDLTDGKSMNKALDAVFEQLGLPPSFTGATAAGWSRLSTLQKCPYLFKKTFVDPPKEGHGVVEAHPLRVGSCLHALLALRDDNRIQPPGGCDDVVTVDMLYQALLDHPLTPLDALNEAWRLYNAYDAQYETDYLEPLAVEYPGDAHGLSCRFDIIAHIQADVLGYPKGTFIIERKSTSKFDLASLEGWRNDGEVLGQMYVYREAGLEERFGPLQGVIIDLIGKQKVPQFRRILLPVQVWQIDAHARDVGKWRALEQLYHASDMWPRSRASCVHRYGLCNLFTHCCNATGDTK